MHKYVTCPLLNSFLLFLNSSTLESWAGCAKASLFIARRSAFPYDPALLPLHAACLLVKAEWITGWSHRGVVWLVEMILHREQTVAQDDIIVFFFFFFFLVWTWCIVVPSPAVQVQSSMPTGGESGVWGAGWSGEPVVVFTVRMR